MHSSKLSDVPVYGLQCDPNVWASCRASGENVDEAMAAEGRALELEDLRRVNQLHLASASFRLRSALLERQCRPRSARAGRPARVFGRRLQRPLSSHAGWRLATSSSVAHTTNQTGKGTASVTETESWEVGHLLHRAHESAHATSSAVEAVLRQQTEAFLGTDVRGAAENQPDEGVLMSRIPAAGVFEGHQQGVHDFAPSLESTPPPPPRQHRVLHPLESQIVAVDSEDSEDSLRHWQENKRRANGWISETVPEFARFMGERALWSEGHARRVEETRLQAAVLQKLQEKRVPFSVWRMKRAEQRAISERSTPVKCKRMDSLPEGEVVKNSVRDLCVVSFPGNYLSEWRGLFEINGPKRIASACVFLPHDDRHRRYGHHTQYARTPGKCYCRTLYGEKKDWGCLWFKQWMANVKQALRYGLTPVVVFFPKQENKGVVAWEDLAREGHGLWNGVGLGGSQKAEVAWLIKQGITFRSTDVLSVHKLFSNKDSTVVVSPEVLQAKQEELSQKKTNAAMSLLGELRPGGFRQEAEEQSWK